MPLLISGKSNLHLRVKKINLINFFWFIIFVGILLGLPNIAATNLEKAGFLFLYHIVSTNTLIFFLAYFYLIRKLKEKHTTELKNRYVILFLLMLGLIFLSGFNAYDVKLGLLYFRNYLSYFLLLVLILWRLKTKEDILFFFKIFSVFGTVFAMAILLVSDITKIFHEMQFFQAGKLLAYRLTIFDISVNTLGYILVVLFIINLTLLKQPSRWKIIVTFSTVLALFLIFMSFSRGIFLAFAAGAMVYFLFTLKSFKSYLYLLLVGFLSYFILSRYYYFFIERVGTLRGWLAGEYIDASIALRVANFKEAIHLGMEHLLLGIGGYNLDNFLAIGTHNQFLDIFAENGIFTFIIYFLFILLVTIGLLSISKKLKNNLGSDRYERNISVCLAAIMCSSLVQGVVSYLRYDFWVICAVSIAWLEIVKRQMKISRQTAAKELIQE